MYIILYYANSMLKKPIFYSAILLFILSTIHISWGLGITSGSFLPLPPPEKYDKKLAKLGKQLFQDDRLSKDNQNNCNRCHFNQLSELDRRAKAIGPNNKQADFNTPSLYNITLFYTLFWDGRETDLKTAIKTHIENPSIMGGKWPKILAALSNDKLIVHQFKTNFKKGLTEQNIVTALIHYLTSLNYTPSRFDTYLRGDINALTVDEKMGLKKFMEVGCHMCHQGKLMGANLMMPLGLVYDYPGNPNRKRYRVPSLRNISKTAPYFHDGSIATLASAVRIMAKYQTGVELDEDEINSIVLFLKTLDSNLIQDQNNDP